MQGIVDGLYKKVHRFVQYTLRKCFDNFIQSALDARRQIDENPNSSVVAENMKPLANSSYGYQIMDCSRHTVTKYLTDEKICVFSKMFKRPNHITDQLYELELVKSENQIVWSSLTYNTQNWECWNFTTFSSKKFCDTDKYEEPEKDTDPLYLALSEENLEDVLLPDKRAEWDKLRSKDWTDNSTVNATDNLFPRTCCNALKKQDKRESGLFKEDFTCAELLCLCSKTYCCYDRKSNKYKFSNKGLNKRTLEDCGDGPLSKYRKVLQETVNITLTNRGFRTILPNVATYEQTKKRLSDFYPKGIVEEDWIHTKPLHF